MLDQMFVPPYALTFYLYKSIAPLGLSCLYPFPVKHGAFLPAKFLLSPIILIFLGALVARSIRHTKAVAFGSLFFLVTILPALQFFPTGTAIVADRFTYIPSIGLSFLVARLVVWLYAKKDKYGAYLATTALVVIVAAMAVLTWRRCHVWTSNIALWDNAVRASPTSYVPLAYFNRGVVLSDLGMHEQAVADFNKVLMLYYRESGIKQDHNEYCRNLLATGGPAEVYNFIASKYAEIGKKQEAIGCLNLARRLREKPVGPFRPGS
jgi:tetratricopeptide (TPR) repeat protein